MPHSCFARRPHPCPSVALAIAAVLGAPPCWAGIATDGSAGPARTLAGPAFAIGEELGTRKGGNLFHSFQSFSIAQGESANFTGAEDIARVISRVTGGEPSTIDGLIRSEVGQADLYFINPAGVTFGANAQVDVPAAFHVSTANRMRMDDGSLFSVLTSSGSTFSAVAPVAFGFLGAPLGEIRVNGARLQVKDGKGISLVGGDIALNDSTLTAAGGRIDLVATGGPGEVRITAGDLDTDSFSAKGGLTLANSTLNADGPGGGRLSLQGSDVLVRESVLSARSQVSDGLGVGIQASGRFSLVGGVIDTRTSGTGDAGAIEIAANAILLDATGAARETGLKTDSLAASGVVELMVGLDITHTYDADLMASLISPSGIPIKLFDTGIGGYTDGDNLQGTIFRDDAAISISDSAALAPFSGAYRPLDSLSTLRGEPLKGTWVLQVTDTYESEEFGILQGWSLVASSHVYASADLPQDIPGIPLTTTSTVTIKDSDLHVGDVVTPAGSAGMIGLRAPTLEARGDPRLTATAVDPTKRGALLTTGPTTLVAGLPGYLWSTDGVWRFAPDQVVLDGSLGPEVPLAGPDYTIGQSLGSRVGDNLFHSFSSFSLSSDESAVFTGGEDIRNVISRVTGGEISSIDGTIRSEVGEADFYFINPAGMLFGEHAQIDVPAALYLSTAQELRMADGVVFTASNPAADALSTAAPESFGFLGAPAGALRFEGVAGTPVALGAAPGEVLGLTAGTIELNGAEVNAPGGSIFVVATGDAQGAVGTRGRIDIRANGALTLDHRSQLDASDTPGAATGAGRVQIRAGDAALLGGSLVKADNHSDRKADGGIDWASDTLLLNPGSRLTADAWGAGQGGAIQVATDRLVLKGGFISAQSLGVGDAGNIRVHTGTLDMEHLKDGGQGGPAYITAGVGISSSGDGGRIEVEVAGDAYLHDAFISTTTYGAGDAGEVYVHARNLTLEDTYINSTGIVSGTSLEGSGDAGSVRVVADGAITLKSGAQIRTSTAQGSAGNAGQVTVRADQISIEGADGKSTGILSSATPEPTVPPLGEVGDIEVAARRILLANGGTIAIDNEGAGGVSGDGHTIRIFADDLLLNHGRITTQSTQGADAGAVELNFSKVLELRESIVTTDARGGNGGDISIAGDNLVLHGGFIQANTQGSGKSGGDINLELAALIPWAGQLIVGGSERIARQAGLNVVQAAAPEGLNGEIGITAPKLDVTADLVNLNSSYADSARLLQGPCAVSFALASLTWVGSGGVPLTPEDTIPAGITPERLRLWLGGAEPVREGAMEPLSRGATKAFPSLSFDCRLSAL